MDEQQQNAVDVWVKELEECNAESDPEAEGHMLRVTLRLRVNLKLNLNVRTSLQVTMVWLHLNQMMVTTSLMRFSLPQKRDLSAV